MSNSDLLKVEDVEFVNAFTPFHGPDSEGSMRISDLDTCARKPLIVTCGRDCYVRVWNFEDNVVEVEKRLDEEPTAVSFHPSGLHLLVAFPDRMQLMNVHIDGIEFERDIHMSRASACSFSNGGSLFAAVQESTVKICATFDAEGALRELKDGHSNPIQRICWSKDDASLFTVCSGGAVVEWDVKSGRQRMRFSDDRYRFVDLHVHCRDGRTFVSCLGSLITGDEVKSSLLDIAWTGEEVDHIPFVSATLPLWKSSRDPRHTSFDTFAVSSQNRAVYVGSSDAQRCGIINAYRWPIEDGASGPGVVDHVSPSRGSSDDEEAVESGKVQTSAASSMLASVVVHGLKVNRAKLGLSSEEELLFTISEDGSLAILSSNRGRGLSKKAKDALIPSSREMLFPRKKLQEINETIRSMEIRLKRDKAQNETILRNQIARYAASIDKTKRKYARDRHDKLDSFETLREADEKSRANHRSDLETFQSSHRAEMSQMDSSYKRKVDMERDRCTSLLKEKKKVEAEWKTTNEYIRSSHVKYVSDLRTEYELKMQNEQKLRAKNKISREKVLDTLRESSTQIEDKAQTEILEMRATHVGRLKQEQTKTRELKKENDTMKVRHDALRKEIGDQRLELKSLRQRERDRLDQIKSLQKDTTGYKKEIHERDDTIRAKEARIYDLKKKSQELEKFKFVLDYKIKELRRQIEPRMNEIVDTRAQMKEMEEELAQYQKSNAALNLMIRELQLKLDGMERELQSQRASKSHCEAMIHDIHIGLRFTKDVFASPEKYKETKKIIRRLYEHHIEGHAKKRGHRAGHHGGAVTKTATTTTTKIGSQNTEQSNDARERDHLERSVQSLKNKLSKDLSKHQSNIRRLTRENVLLTTEVNKLRRDLKTSKQMSRARATDERQKISNMTTTESKRVVDLQRLKILQLGSYLAELEALAGPGQ